MIFQMVKKSCIGMIILSSLLSLPIFANARITVIPANIHAPIGQTASDESIEKLMNLQQFDKTFEAQNQQTISNLQQSTANLLKDKTISPEMDARAQKIFNDFIADSMQELNSPTVKAQYKANYISALKATYNQQEVDTLIDFYSSPIGQQIVKKQDDFNADLMQRNLPIMQKWQEDLLNDKMPKAFNDLMKLK